MRIAYVGGSRQTSFLAEEEEVWRLRSTFASFRSGSRQTSFLAEEEEVWRLPLRTLLRVSKTS